MLHRLQLQVSGRWIAWGALALSSALSAAPAAAQDSLYLGRTGIEAPPRNDAGEFSGTWFYVNRDWKVALWIEDQEGGPQIKLRLSSVANGEALETDWGAETDYSFRTLQGHFSAKPERRDANLIEGTWDWVLGPEGARRHEHAEYSMYRSGDGRQLVLKFTNFERAYDNRQPRLSTELLVWTFRKASRRQALWAELPF